MHDIAYFIRFIRKIFTELGKLPFLRAKAVKNPFSWRSKNLVQFFIFMFSQERRKSFNYFFY